MDRIMKYGGQCEGTLSLTEVPIGWQRKIHHTGVVYVSPSGSVLACLEQVKTYLLTDGTCKCGLECPLILHKIFNYNPGAVVKLRTAEDAQADAEVTKLCIHKRKIIAVATLHRSMEPPHLSSSGNGMAHVVPLNHHAIQNNMLNCPSNSVALDKKNPYKMLGEQYHQCELSSPPQINVYTGHSRSRLGGSDHSSQRSPYRSNHSVLLSPPSSNPCGSQRYCDGTPSPRAENLRSPDPSVHGFHGALSPCSSHLNGEHFTTLLQQPGISLQSSPSAAQPSCTMAGRTNVPLSSSVNVKNPNTQKSPCSFPHSVDYQHKLQHACHSQSHLSMSQLPPCVVQKKQVVSEKDPLGILDPIPSKAHSQEPPNRTPSSFQFHSQPQVSSMNVKIPPTIVPLPSNLPLPTVKSGPVGHVQRAQNPTPSSVSSSPVMSPENITGPNPARVEETQHNSRCSSLTSDHSSFVHAQNVQVSCGSSKLPSRAQRASMVSPRPSLPLHHLKDASNQLRGAISGGLSRLHSSKCLPATGPDISHPNKHSTGVAPQQLLNQQNPSSYPASTLLSAAAKAQLGNQNKRTDTLAGAEGQASQGLPGLVGGGRQRNLDGQSTLVPRYLPNTGPFTGDGQSGRAALRDKLMAQQRGVVRKRKQPSNTCSSDMTYGMHEQRVPGSVSSGFTGSMRRVLQQGGLPPNTSMAQLLQSMSHQNQSAQNGLNHVDLHPARSDKSPFFEETVTQMSTLPSNQGPTQIQARTELNCQNIKSKEGLNVSGNLSIEQFASAIDQLHDPAFGGNFEAFGYPRQPMRSMVNPNSHKQHFGQYHKGSQGNIPLRDRTGLPSMMSNGGVNTLSQSGEASSISSILRQAQEESLLSLVRTSQTVQQQLSLSQQQQLAQDQFPVNGQHVFSSRKNLLGQVSGADCPSSIPTDRHLHTFQVGLAEMVSHPNRAVISPSVIMSQPSVPSLQECQREYQATQAPFDCGDVFDSNRQATMSMTIESMLSSKDSFVVPLSRSHTSNNVIDRPLNSYPQESKRRQTRVGRPRKKLDRCNNYPGAAIGPTPHATRRRCVMREVEGQHPGLWVVDKQVKQSFLDLNVNGYYTESFEGLPYERSPSQFNGVFFRNSTFTHMNGQGDSEGSGNVNNIHSLGQSSGLNGDSTNNYSQFNGHFIGRLNGQINGHYKGSLNGQGVPSALDTVGSEVKQRHPDILFTSQMSHHQPRMHLEREHLWGQSRRCPPWSSDLGREGKMYHPGVLNGIYSKVEPESCHKTVKQDLESLHKANTMYKNGAEVNSHFEAAIQDAMNKLDKWTGHIDKPFKGPKSKRRKISR